MFCKKCGSVMKDNQKFCPKCGEKVADFASSHVQSLTKKTDNAYVFKLIGSVLLILVPAVLGIVNFIAMMRQSYVYDGERFYYDFKRVFSSGFISQFFILFSILLLGVKCFAKTVFMHLRDVRKKSLIFIPNLLCSLILIIDAVCVGYLYFSGFDSKQYTIYYTLGFLGFVISGIICLVKTIKNRNKPVEFPKIKETVVQSSNGYAVSQNSVNTNTAPMQDAAISEKPKQKPINIVANVFWFIFGGFASGLGWVIAGALWCITIIGIPLGKQCFKFAKLTAVPFGRDIIYTQSTSKTIVNIIWLLFTGLSSAVTYALAGVVFCVTIIGIPFGLQYFKFAKLMLMPFGAQIVYKQ